MYQSMKRHSLLAVLPRLVIALGLAVLLLGLTVGAVLQMAAGPADLDQLGTQAQVGDYVQVDMSQLMSAYASLSTEEDGESIRTYYVLHLQGDVYLSLTAPGKYDDSFSRATDQAYDYYRNDSGILNPMGTLRGQLTALAEDDLTMLQDWVTQSALPGFETEGETTGTILALDLTLNQVGLLSITWNWILFALGLVCLAWFVVELVLVLSGRYFRQVRQALAQDPQAEAQWQSATVCGNARLGEQYIWYTRGPTTQVFALDEVVWVYKQFDARVTGRYKWPVSVFTKSQAYHELCVREDTQRDELIRQLRAQGAHFVAGYSQDNYDQYCNDFKAFCARAAADDPEADAPLIRLPD